MRARVYRRTDGRWEAQWLAGNGKVVATTHSQGYERKRDALRAVELVGATTVLVVEG